LKEGGVKGSKGFYENGRCIIINGQAHPWVVPLGLSHLDFSKLIEL
jgi:hypothetical protein